MSFLGIGFVTIGLGADPAVRADLPPSGRTLGHLWSFVPGGSRAVPATVADLAASPNLNGGANRANTGAGVDSLALLGFDTTRQISELLQRLGQVLGQVPALPPRVPLAVPLTDVAGHEASRNPGGGPADSNPQAVHAGLSGAAVTDAGGNSLVRMRFDRSIETLAAFDSWMVDAPPFVGTPGTKIPMESVPTGVVARGGAYFVSELTGFPFEVGAARVHRVVPGKAPQVYATGLTNAIDLDFGPDGALYVLEIAHNGLLAEKPLGALMKVQPGKAPEVVLGGLESPTGLTIRNKVAYISDCGTCAGKGRVLRVPL